MSDLYHVSYRKLVAQVYAFTTDLTEAQDAVQEAFARALARRNGLSDIDSPEAWLRTVAVNIVRRRWRRKQILNTILLRERPLTKMLEDPPEPDRADLRDALASLPRSYREVIVLHYLADLPVDEVAAILEVPVGTVKSRLSRGREALKGLLDDVETPPLDQVKKRAGQIRTRRRVAKTSTALVLVCASAFAFFSLRPPELPPTDPPTPRPVETFAGSGITIRSVFDPATVPDIPGKITEFNVDGQDILRTDEGTYARSTDGGQTWEIIDYTPTNSPPWGGVGVPVALKGGMWISPRPTPSGVWWANTVSANGRLELAYSKDPANNSSWRTIALNVPMTNIAASVSGEKVVVIAEKSVFLGDTNGFQKVTENPSLPAVSGEPILLPDGRLLIADTASQWQLSSDMGATWAPAAVGLRQIGSLHATRTGYVALDFLRVGWVLVSPDGVNWQKLPIR